MQTGQFFSPIRKYVNLSCYMYLATAAAQVDATSSITAYTELLNFCSSLFLDTARFSVPSDTPVETNTAETLIYVCAHATTHTLINKTNT